MRRAPFVLAGTAAGLAAVLSFKPREPTLAATPPVSASPSPSATATAKSSSGSRRTASGDVIPTVFGNTQVRVTISGGKIAKIEALQLPSNEPRSVMISSSAEPLLRQRVLTKQSAAIDAVSGATITSASYEASLQSALDKLGYKAPDGSRGSSTVPDVEVPDDGGFIG